MRVVQMRRKHMPVEGVCQIKAVSFATGLFNDLLYNGLVFRILLHPA